jgi:hypothetical protein
MYIYMTPWIISNDNTVWIQILPKKGGVPDLCQVQSYLEILNKHQSN